MLIATTNPGKIREIRLLFSGLPLAFRTLADLPPVAEPEENGRTFAENARLKAQYYARGTGLTTIAEDSGLEIDALRGRPGVESARYPGATYPDKFQNLYHELAGHVRPWTARYVCAVAVVQGESDTRRHGTRGSDVEPDAGQPPVFFTVEGTVDGEVWPEPRGTHGFGYDPIFYYPPYGATFGEMDDQTKLAVAHRGRAFRLVADWLRHTKSTQ